MENYKLQDTINDSNEIINNYIDMSKTDLRGKITYVTQMFCNTVGYTKDELIGQCHNIVRSPYTEESLYEELWDTITKNKTFVGNLQNKTKDGDIIWFEATIKPEFDSNGKKIGYIAYRKNITNEKNLQELVKKQIEQIRQKDLQINEQTKIAAMRNMIENIAHQWRQPLSLISTVATGLHLQIEHDIFNKDEAMKSLEKLDEASQYLSNTIDDFREFFKKEKKKKEFSLKDNCKKCLSLVQPTLHSHKIDLVKLDNRDNEDIKMMGYPNELSQAIVNILNNAKDALDNYNCSKKLIFTKLEKIDNKAVIVISDNGGGISKDIINNIFEPYFTTKHKSQGTGLGLYMTKEIITKHFNGTIDVSNKNIQYNGETYFGASFRITLPLS